MIWGYTELRCPFEAWEDKEVREIFSQMVAVKKAGYQFNYSSVLPVDTLDFISDHYLVWKIVDGEKRYIAGMKGISLETVTRYKQSLPCVSLLSTISKVANVKLHLQVMNSLINEFKGREELAWYYNGWTMHPDFRGKDNDSRTLVLASVATIAFAQDDHKAGLGLGSGMPHLKTDKVFAEMGYHPWKLNQEELPSLPSPNYDMRETVFIEWRKNPEAYMERVKFLKRFWNNREILGTHMREHQEKKSA